MSEKIRLENISVAQHAENWQEAIRLSGELLVRCGSITPKYVESMIESVNTLGPYIVMMPHFALAHAAPCEDVKVSDMSIVTFKEGVNFNTDKDPVTIVMTLACTDKQAHIERLQSIAMKLMEEGMVEHMAECQSAEELYHLIND